MSRTKLDMQCVKQSVLADIKKDLHVLLARLGAPKRDIDRNAQDALVLAMIQVGNALESIRNARTGDIDWKTMHPKVSFENCAYTETFETLQSMPWRCVEARDLNPSWRTTTEVPLCEALPAIAPVVLMLKGAQFSLADVDDAERWGRVLATVGTFERAYAEHTGEAFGLAVAIRAFSGAR
jgi:hypothetical protein